MQRFQSWSSRSTRGEKLHIDLPLTLWGLEVSHIWCERGELQLIKSILLRRRKKIILFNVEALNVGGMDLHLKHLVHQITFLVSQSASATFCSAANSSGACVIWTGNLRKLPNSTRCKLCLRSGILLQWIGIFHWGFGSWCILQHLDYLNRRPTHVFVR